MSLMQGGTYFQHLSRSISLIFSDTDMQPMDMQEDEELLLSSLHSQWAPYLLSTQLLALTQLIFPS